MEQMTKANVVKLARDVVHGSVSGNYSMEDSHKTLINALIAANGGSTAINYKSMRRNGVELFEILEVALPELVMEGLRGDEFFMNLVEERNLGAGDLAKFIVPDNSTFIVSKIADGVATPRRQRIGESTEVTVNTETHAIRIYEELSRVMSGRVDWVTFVNKVTEAFRRAVLDDVYAVFTGLSASTMGLSSNYVKSGTYDEETLMQIVDHVEAATGAQAKIIGTKPALRKCTSAILSDSAKEDRYNIGYYARLNGTDMIYVRNRHKIGSEEFVFPDNKLYVIAGDDKFIKLVREGEAIIREEDGSNKNDLSMEYLYMERYGVAAVLNGKIGIYTLA